MSLLARLSIVALIAGCAHTPPAPDGALPADGLARFYQVAPGVFRSPQPSAEQFKVIQARYGIRSVVKLNLASEGHDVLPAGVELIHHPMSAVLEPSAGELADLMKAIEAAPKPTLLHCSHGVDRTGLVVGIYRVRHGSLASAAWMEMLAYGFHQDLWGLKEAFERETGYRP